MATTYARPSIFDNGIILEVGNTQWLTGGVALIRVVCFFFETRS